MEHSQALITEPYVLLAIMMLIPVLFMNLESWTRWKLWEYLPPVIWVFVLPIVLSGTGIVPTRSETYDDFKAFAVPMFIVLMLLDVDLRSTMKVALRSLGVLVLGALGVVAGGMIAFFMLKSRLDPEAWRGFGALAGSWIGGTGNLAAVAEAVDTPPTMMGLVVVADTFIFILYFPLLFACKRWAKRFAHFSRVTQADAQQLERAVGEIKRKTTEVHYKDILTLVGIAFFLIWGVRWLSQFLPVTESFSGKTWQILILTTVALVLAATPLRRVPGTGALSMALVYTYLSMIGAEADIRQAVDAPYFLIAGVVCIVLHLLFVVVAARLFRTDVHLTAIASVAAIGGAASAPVVAAYHRKELVPVSIVLALAGYALGNYLGILAAHGCRLMM